MAHQGGGVFSKFFSFFDATNNRHINRDRLTATPWSSSVPYDLDETVQRKNSHLGERSNLIFEFPNAGIIGGPPTRLLLPFFEDPAIRERKKARYATLNPIGRSSNLFAYTGADAREFSLDFNMTLPNILDFMKKAPSLTTQYGPGAGTIEEKNLFFGAANPLKRDVTGPKAQDYENISPQTDPPLATRNAISGEAIDDLRRAYRGTHHQNYLRTIDVIRYWTDIIRSSCYNNTSNPSLGPPIIRLTHGILFRNLPCIVESYNITFDKEVAGFDKNTLLPRRLIISMTLKELRAGNYGQFNVGEGATQVEQDNLAGWEVIVDGFGGTLDPVPFRSTGSKVVPVEGADPRGLPTGDFGESQPF